jgi:glutamate formiminotransferase/formiminotetrahydrofolate cyclodeaminase
MTAPLLECVPSFSEGRDPAVIQQIAERLESVEGARLLSVEPGRATNRTVMTLVGPREKCASCWTGLEVPSHRYG